MYKFVQQIIDTTSQHTAENLDRLEYFCFSKNVGCFADKL